MLFALSVFAAITIARLLRSIDWEAVGTALRFVGIDAQALSLADIAVAFLFAFPLTAFPMGMGVVDVLITGACVEAAGTQLQEPVFAALIIWRIFNVSGPLLLGVVAGALWKHSTKKPGLARPNFD